MVQADAVGVSITGPRDGADPIGAEQRIDGGIGRQRRGREKSLRDRTDPRRIDRIRDTSISQSLPRAGRGIGCKWVVEFKLPALLVDQPAKIAIAHRLGWDGPLLRRVGDNPIGLPSNKEEGS